MAMPRDYHAYCDESYTAGRYMVYGAIMTASKNVKVFDETMAQWRAETNMLAELKWTRVSRQKLPEYKSLVDLYFDHQKGRRLFFKAVVVDKTEINDTFTEGDAEIGFYKFYYHFLLHKFGPFARDETHRLFVFLDQRSTRYKIRSLRSMLDGGIRKKYGLGLRGIVRQVEPLNSKHSNLLQLADVLMGGIGWEFNGMGLRPGANRANIELAAYVAERAHLKTLGNSTVRGKYDFQIWRWKFLAAQEKRSDA